MIDIELLNPEVVENLYRNHGLFACVCYATPDSRSEKVGRKCQESGHMSGSRCEYIKFRISGIDRGTAEQCLLHEIGTAVPLAEESILTSATVCPGEGETLHFLVSDPFFARSTT